MDISRAGWDIATFDEAEWGSWGSIRNQGVTMNAGDAYVAATGSTHTDFETETGAKYVTIFELAEPCPSI